MKNVSGAMTLLLIGVAMFFAGCTTSLMDAAARGDTKEMERLIAAGAKLETSGDRFTPLHYAVYKGQLGAVRLLIEKGASTDKAVRFWGDRVLEMCTCTPLYLAVLNRDTNMVALLLEKGANPDKPVVATDRTKTTPFETAQEQGNIVVVEMFRKAKEKMLAKYVPAADVASAVPPPAVKETTSDVDDLPSVKAKPNQNAYAIVIGIETYREKLPKADYATHDAKTMTEYLTKVMGYPEENVVTLVNDRAAKSDLEKYLEKWLPNHVEKGGAVFVYYSGHGAPDTKTGGAFLVPYDGDPSFINETGYSLKRLYEALGKLQTDNIVVALDSCFSGAGGKSVLAKGARPIVITLDHDANITRDMTIMSASAGDQISSTYAEKGHGLFTYFFLKGLKGDGDANGDGRIEVNELYSYLKPLVGRTARRVYNNEQSPQLIAPAEKRAVFLR